MKKLKMMPASFKITKSIVQVGDNRREVEVTYSMTLHNSLNHAGSRDLTLYVGSYVRSTKVALFRNYKNQLVTIKNVGVREMDEMARAVAQENFEASISQNLFRPQHNLQTSY